MNLHQVFKSHTDPATRLQVLSTTTRLSSGEYSTDLLIRLIQCGRNSTANTNHLNQLNQLTHKADWWLSSTDSLMWNKCIHRKDSVDPSSSSSSPSYFNYEHVLRALFEITQHRCGSSCSPTVNSLVWCLTELKQQKFQNKSKNQNRNLVFIQTQQTGSMSAKKKN